MTSPTRAVIKVGERYRANTTGVACVVVEVSGHEVTVDLDNGNRFVAHEELTLFEMAPEPTSSKVCARCDRPIGIAKVDGVKRWTATDLTSCPQWPPYFCVPADFCVTSQDPKEITTMRTPDTNQPPTTSDPCDMMDTSHLVPLFELNTETTS